MQGWLSDFGILLSSICTSIYLRMQICRVGFGSEHADFDYQKQNFCLFYVLIMLPKYPRAMKKCFKFGFTGRNRIGFDSNSIKNRNRVSIPLLNEIVLGFKTPIIFNYTEDLILVCIPPVFQWTEDLLEFDNKTIGPMM